MQYVMLKSSPLWIFSLRNCQSLYIWMESLKSMRDWLEEYKKKLWMGLSLKQKRTKLITGRLTTFSLMISRIVLRSTGSLIIIKVELTLSLHWMLLSSKFYKRSSNRKKRSNNKLKSKKKTRKMKRKRKEREDLKVRRIPTIFDLSNF